MQCFNETRLESIAKDSGFISETVRAHIDTCETCRTGLEEIRENLKLESQLQSLRTADTLIATSTADSQEKHTIRDEEQKYETGAVIGRGGIGKVTLVRDNDLRREVAMKVLKLGRSRNPDQVLRFIEEAQVAGQLEHPNIVPVHELGEDQDGQPFYTMKYVKGVSLDEILRDIRYGKEEAIERYPLSRLLNIFMKICDGVAFAHSKGVIHRDLKPENIMVGDFGEVFVLDWGLAKILKVTGESSSSDMSRGTRTTSGSSTGGADAINVELRSAPTVADDDSFEVEEESGPVDRPDTTDSEISTVREGDNIRHTLEGEVYGTPAFMAPEQAAGRIDEIDRRTDIYALGGILYSILTLNPPVRGQGVKEQLRKAREGQITPPEVFTAESLSSRGKTEAYIRDNRLTVLNHCPGARIPEALSAIAMKALSQQPGDRYHEVSSLRRDIERYMENRAVSAHADTAFEMLKRLVQRNLAASVAVAAASVVILILVAVSYRLNMDERHKAEALRDQALSDQQRAETALTHAEQSQARAVKATEELMAKSRKLSEFLARQAIRAAEEGRFAEAEVRADTAIKIAEKSPWGFFAMGAVFQIQQRSGRARKWLTQALEIDPDHTPSQLALSDLDKNEEQITGAEGLIQNPAKATDWRDFDKSGDLFMSAKKFREAENAYNLGLLKMQQTKSVKDHDRNELAFKHEDARAWKLSEGFYKTIQHLPEDAQRSRIRLKVNEIHGYQVGCNPKFENGIVESVWFGQNVKHLHVLRGMELKWLNIGSRPSIRSLEPLRGMPLKALMIQFTDVRDLSPLTGMPLEHLDSVNNVSDISPLRGMPLKKLVAPRGVRDFSPIEGMPLEEVSFYANTGVYNIDFLKGMRLRKISLPPSVREVSPLRGMPLEQIDVLLAHRYDVDFLRETKTLKKINKMPAEEFWQKIDDYRARIANKAKEEEDERLAQIKAARPEGWQFEVRTIPDLGIELVHLPSGSFMMGATNGPDDEKPVHKVTISRPFWMAKTELTQKQYQSLTGKNPSRFKGDNRPVESLFWGSAFNYCKVLTNRERRAGKVPPGYVYRLPSEAEWEYACRAGTRTDWYFGGKEHYKEHVVPMAFPGSKKTTRDVGSLKPNPWDSMTCTAASKSSASTAAIDEA